MARPPVFRVFSSTLFQDRRNNCLCNNQSSPPAAPRGNQVHGVNIRQQASLSVDDARVADDDSEQHCSQDLHPIVKVNHCWQHSHDLAMQPRRPRHTRSRMKYRTMTVI